MTQAPLSCIARWATMVTVLLAAACGGGGGGGDSGPAPIPQVTSTGLVPAAQPPGATLYSDARTLRPMGAGSRWTYHSHDYTIGNVRETTVRHETHPQGGIAETGADGDTTRITVDTSGNIRMS